jgi:spore maturation protein CgeB
VLSDRWPGLDSIFRVGREILVGDARAALALGDEELAAIGRRARERVLAEHTAEHRAAELEQHVRDAAGARV